MLSAIFTVFSVTFNYGKFFLELVILLLTKLIETVQSGAFCAVHSHLFPFKHTKGGGISIFIKNTAAK